MEGGVGAGAGAGGAGAASGGAPGGAAPSAPAGGWTSGLNPEVRGWVETKGFKDVGTALDSYRNLEKLMGVDKNELLRLPRDKADADGWKAVRSKLGWPEKADGYGLQAPEGGDPEFTKQYVGWAHELGLTIDQAKGLFDKYNEAVKAGSQKSVEATEADFLREESELKAKHGNGYSKLVENAKRVINQYGISEEALGKLEAGMGWSGGMEFLASIGAGLGEHQFEGGQGKAGANGGITPDSAKSRIQDLTKDGEFLKRVMSGDSAAKQEWDNLHLIAYGGR